jgi:hypothetical protein
MEDEDYEEARVIIAALIHGCILASQTIAQGIIQSHMRLNVQSMDPEEVKVRSAVRTPDTVADMAVQHTDALIKRLKDVQPVH